MVFKYRHFLSHFMFKVMRVLDKSHRLSWVDMHC